MFESLCNQLAELSQDASMQARWPSKQLRLCAEHGVFRWFLSPEYGGNGWDERQQIEGYLAISQACLTTAFVLTQWNAATKRIAFSPNKYLRDLLLPRLASGELFATVGISHLTTSRQYLAIPAVRALRQYNGGYLLTGFSPWVTGACHSDWIVLGGTLDGGDQLLCAIPRDRVGVETGPGVRLVALTASCTDQVGLRDVDVRPDEVLAGPMPNVMHVGASASSGGLQTSALAIGLATAAIGYLCRESIARTELKIVSEKFERDLGLLKQQLLRVASGEAVATASELRQKANSLVLRATQAALAAAKGAGFVDNHCASRWCREALFFLVWSCPQPVLSANLCELAQLE